MRHVDVWCFWGESKDQALARAIQTADPYRWLWADALPVAYQSAPALALDADPESDRGA